MSREDAIKWIDEMKNALVDPVAMLNGVWLRRIVHHIPADVWSQAVAKAAEDLSR